jgi:hypothetical protein
MDIIATCKQYAIDLRDVGGCAITVTLDKDVNAELQFTHNVWPDGVPVSKMFDRNGDVSIHMMAGTVLHGVVYTGRRTHMDICEFWYVDAWYRTYMVNDDGTVFGCNSSPI